VSVVSEFTENGAIVLKKALCESDFSQIDGLLEKHWKKFSIDDPYKEFSFTARMLKGPLAKGCVEK
jgi:hypothetical protein